MFAIQSDCKHDKYFINVRKNFYDDVFFNNSLAFYLIQIDKGTGLHVFEVQTYEWIAVFFVMAISGTHTACGSTLLGYSKRIIYYENQARS